jgi:hypothetical protein
MDCSKIYCSIYSTNEYHKQYLKEAGFKFNKTTTEYGNPEQRNIYFLYEQDLTEDLKQRAVSPYTNKSLSTRMTSNRSVDPKFSVLASPISKISEKLPSSFGSSRYLSPSSSLPKITFHKLPQNTLPNVSASYSSIGVSANTPLPNIIPPNYYYRSSRVKNNALMDSVVAMDQEILRESQSLEELKESMDSSSFIPSITKTGRTHRNSGFQFDISPAGIVKNLKQRKSLERRVSKGTIGKPARTSVNR